MSGSVFLDTNILAYLFSIDEPDKRDVAMKIVSNDTLPTSVYQVSLFNISIVLSTTFSVFALSIVPAL